MILKTYPTTALFAKIRLNTLALRYAMAVLTMFTLAFHVTLAQGAQNKQLKIQIDTLNQKAKQANTKYLSEAKQLAEEALALSDQISYPEGKAEALSHLGYSLIISGKYDSAHLYLTEGSKLAKELGLISINSDILKKKAAAFYYTGDTDSSLFYFKQALTQYESLSDSLEVIKLLNNIGAIAFRNGHLEVALTHFLKCLVYDEKKGDERGIASDCNNIGLVLTDQKDYKSAIEYLNRSTAIRENLRDTLNLAGNYQNTGNIFRKLGDYKKSLEYYKQGFSMADSSKNIIRYAALLHNIGEAHSNLQEDVPGLAYLNRSARIKESLGDKSGLASTYGSIASIYYRLNQFNSALDYAQKSEKLASETGDLAYRSTAIELILLSRLSLTNQGSSVSLFTEFKALNDSFYNVESARRIAELQTQYETEKKDSEIKTLKAEAQIKELEIANTRIVVMAVILVAVLLIGLILYINRQRAIRFRDELQKDRFKVVIEAEEKERKRVARELHDGLGQMLSTVRLFISDFDDRKANPKVDRSLKALDATIAEVRSISHNLMPLKLMELGLPAAVTEMAEKISVSNQLQVKVENLDLLTFDESTSVGIYRTLQEVVNNAIKYAKATSIQIAAAQAGNSVSISVKDDGQGFNTEEIAKSKGIGWSNIFSRVELIGGTVLVKSGKEGTTVQLLIPAAILMRKAG